MCSHVSNRGEQTVRYYGYYSNASRGNRRKENSDDSIPCIIESDAGSPAKRKAWARLIQKIYEVDPLTCPAVSGSNEGNQFYRPARSSKTDIAAPGAVGDAKTATTEDQIAATGMLCR